MGIVDQTNGFGLLLLAFPFYMFFVEKSCIHTRVALIGLLVLCLINIVIMSVLNTKIWYYDLSSDALREAMLEGDNIGTLYDCFVILVTFIVAGLFFIKEEIICKKSKT